MCQLFRSFFLDIRPRHQSGRLKRVEEYSKNLAKTLAVVSYFMPVHEVDKRLVGRIRRRLADYHEGTEAKEMTPNDLKKVLLEWQEEQMGELPERAWDEMTSLALAVRDNEAMPSTEE